MPVINWVYRSEEPTNVAAVKNQILLNHRYRNQLIELEHNRRATYKTLAASLCPAYADAVTIYDRAVAELDEAYKDLRLSRQRARRRHEPTDSQKARINQAKAVRKTAIAQLDAAYKVAKKLIRDAHKVYQDQAAQEITQLADETESQLKRQRKVRYFELVEEAGLDDGQIAHAREAKIARQQSGVYWGTSRIMEQIAEKTYKKGPPPKFRRWEGSGAIGVRFQGGKPVAAVMENNSEILHIHIPPGSERLVIGQDRGEVAKGTIRFLVCRDDDGNPVFATFPYVHHRDFPASAKIIDGFAHLKRVGKKEYWEIRLTIKVDDVVSTVDKSNTCVLHLGHRMIDEQLRCATVMDATQQVSQLFLSSDKLRRFSRPDSLQGIRADRFNIIRGEFLDWLASIDVPEWLVERTQTLASHQSPESLYRTVELWRDNRFVMDTETSAQFFTNSLPWAESKLNSPAVRRKRHPSDIQTVFGIMEFWRSWDRHILQESASINKKAIRNRKHVYRDWLRRLSGRYTHLIVDSTNWATLGKKEKDDEKVVLVANQRRLARIASPGLLRQCAVEIFGQSNVSVVTSVNMTRTCSTCGQVTEDWDSAKLEYHCSHCTYTVDQDINAANIMLSRIPDAVPYTEFAEAKRR